MGSESMQKRRKTRTAYVPRMDPGRIFLFFFLIFCVVAGIYFAYRPSSDRQNAGAQNREFSMMEYSKQKPIPYKEWVRRRQEIALKPLHPAATLNKTEVGKWIFRKVMIDNELKPQYYNIKTHEVKWLKPPKDLAHYEEELDKNAEVEGGGVLSLMDILLKQRAEMDARKSKSERSDEDEEDSDEEIVTTKAPGSGRTVGEDRNDGGWVFSPKDVVAEKEKRNGMKIKKEEDAKSRVKEEDEKRRKKSTIPLAKGETAKSIVAKYLAGLREKNVDYKHR